MNKRAKQRLIGVSAIIVIIVAAAFVTLQNSGNEEVSVSQVAAKAAPGERVKLTGIVVDDSWDGKANPMRFKIRDVADEAVKGEQITVVYKGVVPSGFGNKTKTILTGSIQDGEFVATDMLTQCPSKYKAKGAPLSVAELLVKRKEGLGDVTVKTTGWLVDAPADQALKLQSRRDGGETIDVIYGGNVPETAVKGAKVEMTGQFAPDGTFKASALMVTLRAK